MVVKGTFLPYHPEATVSHTHTTPDFDCWDQSPFTVVSCAKGQQQVTAPCLWLPLCPSPRAQPAPPTASAHPANQVSTPQQEKKAGLKVHLKLFLKKYYL